MKKTAERQTDGRDHTFPLEITECDFFRTLHFSGKSWKPPHVHSCQHVYSILILHNFLMDQNNSFGRLGRQMTNIYEWAIIKKYKGYMITETDFYPVKANRILGQVERKTRQKFDRLPCIIRDTLGKRKE